MSNFYRFEGLIEALLFVTGWVISGGGVNFKIIFLVNVGVEDLVGTIPAWLSFVVLAPIILAVIAVSAFVYIIELLLSPENEDDGGLLPV